MAKQTEIIKISINSPYLGIKKVNIDVSVDFQLTDPPNQIFIQQKINAIQNKLLSVFTEYFDNNNCCIITTKTTT